MTYLDEVKERAAKATQKLDEYEMLGYPFSADDAHNAGFVVATDIPRLVEMVERYEAVVEAARRLTDPKRMGTRRSLYHTEYFVNPDLLDNLRQALSTLSQEGESFTELPRLKPDAKILADSLETIRRWLPREASPDQRREAGIPGPSTSGRPNVWDAHAALSRIEAFLSQEEQS